MASKKKASSLPLPPPPAPPPAPLYIPPPPPPAPPVIRRVGLPSMEAISNNPELLEILLYAIREKESQHRLDVENNPKSKAEGRMQVIRPLFDMSNKEGLPPGYGIPVMKRGADATEVEAYGRMLFERYISMYGNVRDALVAYNFGPAGTNAWIQGGRKMSDLPEETRLYLPKITRIFERELAKPPEARMEHGRTISLPLSQITVPSKPPKPAPPAPPEKLDPSEQGMTLKAERDLARFHDEPGLVERYAKADATMAAEQALEDRGPRPAEQEPAPTTRGIGFFGYDTGTAEGLLEQARRFLRASRPAVQKPEEMAEPPSMVPFPFEDGGEVDLATIAAGGSGPTEEQRRGVGSLADQARGMFSADGATNVARSVLGQGLMMGWGDEAEAYVRSRYTGRPYEEVLAEIRAENKGYEERNPYGAVVGEIGGGMLPTAAALALTPVTGGASIPAAFMGPAGRLMTSAAARVPTVAYGSMVGGTQGAISGAGSAVEGDRVSGAVEGGALGAGIGAALPYGIQKYLAARDRRALERAAAQVPDDSAYDPLRQRLVDEGIVTQAVKPPGGSWIPASISRSISEGTGALADARQALERLRRGRDRGYEELSELRAQRDLVDPNTSKIKFENLNRDIDILERRLRGYDEAIERDALSLPADEWMHSVFRNYVQNRMGTMEDPVLDLIEETKRIPGLSGPELEAVLGQLHRENLNFSNRRLDAPAPDIRLARVPEKREQAGFNWMGQALSDPARAYEYLTDRSINISPAKNLRPSSVQDSFSRSNLAGDEKLSNQVSKWVDWMKTADPETFVYQFKSSPMTGIMQSVRVALIDSTSDATLPEALRLRPESLKRMSVPEAFDHASKVIAHQEEVARKAQLELLRANSRVDVPEFNLSFVEKPGGNWVDLPDVEKSRRNLRGCTALGDAGGWCTKEEGHAVQYGSGASRLHILVDSEGRPHVQIASVERGKDMPRDIYEIKPPENKTTSARVKSYEDKDPDYLDKIQQATLKFLNSGEWRRVERDEIENIIGSRGAIIDLNAHLSRVVDAETGKLLSREFSPNNFSGRLVHDVTYGRDFGSERNPISLRKSYPEEGDARAALAQAATELAGKDRFMLEEPLVDRARAILGLPVNRADGGEVSKGIGSMVGVARNMTRRAA